LYYLYLNCTYTLVVFYYDQPDCKLDSYIVENSSLDHISIRDLDKILN